MAKTLTDIVKNVKNGVGGMGNYLGKGLGKYLSVGAVAASSYFAGNKAYADKFVNNSMSYTDINATIASATSGEDVHFAAGDYQLPLLVPNSAVFHLGNQGVDLVADGIVTLRGATPTSSASLYITSTNNRISGFVIEGAQKGIVLDADFVPANPIYIQNNTIQNVQIGIQCQNKAVSGSNMLPSVIVDSNYIRVVSLGSLFNEGSGDAVNDTKAWVQLSNNTFEQISDVVYLPPNYTSTNTAAGQVNVFLGLNQMDGNVIINSDGVTLPESAYGGVGGPLNGATTAGTTDIPDSNGEHHIAIDPDPSYPFTAYAVDTWGGNNIASSDIAPAKISWSRRLLKDSPHWADGKCKNPNGSERHYCGAFAPMGDWNADGLVNDYDEDILITKKTGYGIHSTDNFARSIFDFDNDLDIDNDDHVAFLNNGFRGIPQIPTVSTWGLINLGLATLIAGTIVIDRRKKHLTKETSN